jgi:prepilin peptidase CpaA
VTAAEVAAVALGCAAVSTDLRSGVVPNWLTAAGAAAGVVCAGFASGWRGAAAALAGMAAGFLVFLVFHWLGGLAGGDVKLMAAFGALLGARDVLAAAALAAIAGALLACGALLRRPRPASIPYAPAITAGAWLVLWARR